MREITFRLSLVIKFRQVLPLKRNKNIARKVGRNAFLAGFCAEDACRPIGDFIENPVFEKLDTAIGCQASGESCSLFLIMQIK